MRKWKIKDRNGNSVSFVCQSKTQAVEQYKRMFLHGRIDEVVDEGPYVARHVVKVSAAKGESDFRPVEPVRSLGSTGRNLPCACGSGKKTKHCCARRKDVRPHAGT